MHVAFAGLLQSIFNGLHDAGLVGSDLEAAGDDFYNSGPL